MKYLVTGSTGFIGKSLLPKIPGDLYLFSRDQDVSIVSRYQPDVIFHLAAEIYEQDQMFESNIALTYRLLEESRKVPNLKAFIYIGSSSEYGRKDHAMSESDFLDPTTIYEATKGSGSLLCQAFCRTYGVPTIIARPFSLYGKHEPKKRFIPTIIHSIEKKTLLKIAPGSHDFIHIDDFISALFLLIEKGERGEAYNVGTGIQTSNDELVGLIEEIMKKKAIKQSIPKLHSYDSDSWVADYSKIAYLGWEPTYSLPDGISQVIRSYYERN